MTVNISTQLGEALEILKDYPGIAEILDLDAARVFMKKLSESNVASVPDFKEVNSEQVENLIQEDRNSIQEWIDALNDLKGVGAHDDAGNNDDTVIFGGVPIDLASFESDIDNRELYFSFRAGNRADFKDVEGSWAEIYLALIKHVNENLIVPDLPDTK
ncbi:MAG: hypothetical protein KBC98_00190 [Candidatus Pacebacteria bacterium]|jgi:hypothetical protein|nr:hypothetical protein [Candidatus Paceibacterota bacterium]